MKGSGLFILSILLLAAVFSAHQQSLAAVKAEFSGAYAAEAKFAKLSILRNVIQRSYEKTDRYHLDGWRFAVQTTLAEEYGASVAINGTEVEISSNELGTRSGFHVH